MNPNICQFVAIRGIRGLCGIGVISSVGSAEFGSVIAFRHNRVKWATRAEPDTTKQIAPTYFKQKVIMLKKFFVLF